MTNWIEQDSASKAHQSLR